MCGVAAKPSCHLLNTNAQSSLFFYVRHLRILEGKKDGEKKRSKAVIGANQRLAAHHGSLRLDPASQLALALLALDPRQGPRRLPYVSP
jgi:hypothetical protein